MTIRHRAAFSLIELLVAIAIVGLLAALCVPVIKAMLLSGEGSRCAGNLRVIGTAMHLYLQDSGNIMPQRFYPQAQPTKGYDDLLLPYVDNDHVVFRCPSLKKSDFPRQPSYGMNWYYDNVNVTLAAGRTIMAAESAGPGGGGSHRADRDSGTPGELDTERHGGKANYLFFDGHVERLKFAETKFPVDLWGENQGRHDGAPPTL